MNSIPLQNAHQPINVARLRDTIGDDPDFIVELYGIYVDDARNRLANLDSALVAACPERIEDAAHALKGSSGNVGAERMSALAAELERVDFASDPEKARDLTTQLHAEFEAVYDFVKQYLHSPI